MKIVLNGEELDPREYTGAKGSVVEIRDTDDDTGGRVASVSQTYTLTGAAYELVASFFISNPEGKTQSMTVKIYDDACCDEDTLLFTGRLISSNVRWCHGICSVDVIFEEYTDHTAQMDCIMSTLIYDNRLGFQSDIEHPKMVYCVEMRPDFLQHVILIFGVIMNTIFAILTPVVFALSLLNDILGVIEDVINAIPLVPDIDITFDFDGSSATSLMEEYQNMRENINARIIGCGRKHPSPLVRNYIKNVCDICGVGFSSSILNNSSSDYFNTAMLNAPIAKGSISGANWIDLNNPIYTLDVFLDMLKPVFNAKWEIIDGVLHFERKDFFDSGAVYVSFDSLKENNLVIGELCLEWRDETRPAYISFKYAPDPVDIAGNESTQRFNDIVEWNSPYSSLQSGSKEVQLAFGTPRFRDDGVDEDILGMYAWSGSFGSVINSYQGVLILEKHLCFNPKLLIWDGNNPGRTKKYNIPGFTEWPADENYNFPYMFNEHGIVPNTAYESNLPNSALYQRFYSIDNPKLTTDYGKRFEFTFLYNCESLAGALDARYVHLPLGTTEEPSIGRITNISVNLQEKTITIQGNV